MGQYRAYMYDEDAPSGYELTLLSDPFYARTAFEAVQIAKSVWPQLPIAVEEITSRSEAAADKTVH